MPFKSRSQQRKFFAMEARNELPKGTARQWAHETKNISALPEHVKKKKSMKKQAEDGMFFKHASEEAPADGMFFKHAADLPKLDVPDSSKVNPPPTKMVKPKTTDIKSEDIVKGSKLPPQPPNPNELSSMGKHGMLGIPGSEGAADGSGASPEMGVGKPAKKKLEKKADAVDDAMETGKRIAGRVGETGKKIWSGAKSELGKAPEYAEKAMKGIENLPPWAHLALVAGGGLAGLRMLGRGARGVAGAIRGARKPASVGVGARVSNAIAALRGR